MNAAQARAAGDSRHVAATARRGARRGVDRPPGARHPRAGGGDDVSDVTAATLAEALEPSTIVVLDQAHLVESVAAPRRADALRDAA